MSSLSAFLNSNRKRSILVIAPAIALALTSCSPPPSSSVISSTLTPDTSGNKVTSEPKLEPTPEKSTLPVKPPKPTASKSPTPSPTSWNPWGDPTPGFPEVLFPTVPAKPAKPANPVKPVKPTPPAKPVKPVQPTVVKPLPTTVQPHRTLGFLNFFTRSYAQAFGVYDKGRLENPDRMSDEGPGYLKIFRARERSYGSLDLISVVMNAAKELRREIPAVENIQVGDIADKDGGQQGGHGSHQNGLDVDIVFLKRDHREMDVKNEKLNATGFDEDFVDARGNVSRNFDVEANWSYIQLLVASRGIDRIFVDKHIKKSFCEYAVARGMRSEWGATLQKLRHWPHHQDHMHVRLECPSNSKACKPISPIPAGDGCDKLLGIQQKSATGGILRMDAILGEGTPLDENLDEDAGDEHGC